MEEQKSIPEPQKKDNPKTLHYASYSHVTPPEISSFLIPKNPQEYFFLSDYNLEISQNPETPEIFLNIVKSPESRHEILCKIYEIDSKGFDLFLSQNKIPESSNIQTEEEKSKEYQIIFTSKGKNDKILLSSIGEFNNCPLLSISHPGAKQISNIFDEKNEKTAFSLFNEFTIFFKGFFDKGALQYYLRKVLYKSQNKEKSNNLLETMLKEIPLNEEKVESQESKILFSLRTKEFYGAKMLELPKFNKEKGNFETEEKIKLNL